MVHPIALSLVFGHVISHELGHLLLLSGNHEDVGIMRSAVDFRRMYSPPIYRRTVHSNSCRTPWRQREHVMRPLKGIFAMMLVAGSLACDSTATAVAPGPEVRVPQSRAAGSVHDLGDGQRVRRRHDRGGENSDVSRRAGSAWSQDGSFSLSAMAARFINVTAVGFEGVWLAVPAAANATLNARMRPSVTVGVNDRVSLTLSELDAGQDTLFGDSWCEPCRVIRVQSDVAGQIDVMVRWNSAAFLGLWDPGRRGFTAAADGASAFTARVGAKAR